MFSLPEIMPEKIREQTTILSGSAHPSLARNVAAALGLEVKPSEITKFPNGEVRVHIPDDDGSMRDTRAFIVTTGANEGTDSEGRPMNLNDNVMATVHMIGAAVAAKARKITVLDAYMPYSRADRRTREHDSLGVKLYAQALQQAGMKYYGTVDVHKKQSEVAFKKPLEHMHAKYLLLEALRDLVTDPDRFITVAPDEGRLPDSLWYGRHLDTSVDFLAKKRNKKTGEVERTHQLPSVKDKTVLTVDDMIDTAGTLNSLVRSLRELSNARDVIAAATHGIFSDPALERIVTSDFSVIITDTLPMKRAKEALGDRLTVLPIAPVIARTIFQIQTGQSVSKLFNGDLVSPK